MRTSKAQDTFSIVALDSTTRQVGSAGASCVDLNLAGISDPSFLSKLLPDTGAVNIQSEFIQLNQDNAIARLRLGETPAQVITWLVANDANGNPGFKQHGVVAFNGNSPSAAAHTGNTCIDYKNHITGSIQGFHYSIQGNILQGQHILDSMESGFRNTEGSLACRLMAAMQGAKVVGADTRCSNNQTSSLFAFLKVALPTDTAASLNLGVITNATDSIEPIDSLQYLFDSKVVCFPLHIKDYETDEISVTPVPANGSVSIISSIQATEEAKMILWNTQGKVVYTGLIRRGKQTLHLESLPAGFYYYNILSGKGVIKGKIIMQ